MAGPGEASAAAVTARERTEGQALAGRRAACMLDEAMVGRARLGAAVGMHRRAGWSGSMHTRSLEGYVSFPNLLCTMQQSFTVHWQRKPEGRHESAI